MGPGKLLSGIKDLSERLVQSAAQFVVDGPPDIRYGFIYLQFYSNLLKYII
jgi:hypothetical protein